MKRKRYMNMNSRERVIATVNHKEADRVPLCDTVWPTTLERWRREGFPESKTPGEYFNYDLVGIAPDISSNSNGGFPFAFQEELLEETEDWKIIKNLDGAIQRHWKHRTSTPELIDYTIKDPGTWQEHKDKFKWDADKVNWEGTKKMYSSAREQDKFVYFFGGGLGYDRVMRIVGVENLLIALIENPKWVHEMYETICQAIINAAESLISRGFEFDGAFVYDDMGYRNGTLFSPKIFKELEFPYHKRIYSFFKERGMKTILHSCGGIMDFVPGLIEAGLDCLSPLETKAGMDLIKLKKQFGDELSFMGGIDVRKMAHPGEDVMEDEIHTKVSFAKQGGGFIYHSDHSVPDDVSFERYRKVVKLVLRYGSY